MHRKHPSSLSSHIERLESGRILQVGEYDTRYIRTLLPSRTRKYSCLLFPVLDPYVQSRPSISTLICLSAFRKANINVVLLGDKSSSKRRKIINEHVNPVYHLRLAFGLVRLERTCRSCITG